MGEGHAKFQNMFFWSVTNINLESYKLWPLQVKVSWINLSQIVDIFWIH